MRVLLIVLSALIACTSTNSRRESCVGCDLDVEPETTRERKRAAERLEHARSSKSRAGSEQAMVSGGRGKTELIDVDFNKVDVHNALRILAEVGKINIVISDEIRGDVTLRLRRVTWRQAINAVVGLENLRLVESQGVFRVEPR